jgi:hypothetical protein
VTRHLMAFGRFWWDFVVGDDWRIAVGVTLALTTGALLVATESASDAVVATVVTAGIVIAAAVTLASRSGER